jgi:hypothetical protein
MPQLLAHQTCFHPAFSLITAFFAIAFVSRSIPPYFARLLSQNTLQNTLQNKCMTSRNFSDAEVL